MQGLHEHAEKSIFYALGETPEKLKKSLKKSHPKFHLYTNVMIFKYYTEKPVSASINVLANSYSRAKYTFPLDIDWLNDMRVEMIATVTAHDQPVQTCTGFTACSKWYFGLNGL